MASVYSRSHYNMSLSKEFNEGITNGAAWYGKISYIQHLVFINFKIPSSILSSVKSVVDKRK